MRKKHAASDVAHMSMCGRDCTVQEYRIMRYSEDWYVTCKHCLRLLR
jgi:hypothetical protein